MEVTWNSNIHANNCGSKKRKSDAKKNKIKRYKER